MQPCEHFVEPIASGFARQRTSARGASFARLGAIVAASAFIVLSSGCASLRQPRCAPGEDAAVSELLYFGTDKPGGLVTAQDWAGFLASAVTPRFPQGLTVWPASGQYQGAGGGITREASYVLSLIHPDDEPSERAVRAIATEYKSRFSQEAVLRVKGRACISF